MKFRGDHDELFKAEPKAADWEARGESLVGCFCVGIGLAGLGSAVAMLIGVAVIVWKAALR